MAFSFLGDGRFKGIADLFSKSLRFSREPEATARPFKRKPNAE